MQGFPLSQGMVTHPKLLSTAQSEQHPSVKHQQAGFEGLHRVEPARGAATGGWLALRHTLLLACEFVGGMPLGKGAGADVALGIAQVTNVHVACQALPTLLAIPVIHLDFAGTRRHHEGITCSKPSNTGSDNSRSRAALRDPKLLA